MHVRNSDLAFSSFKTILKQLRTLKALNQSAYNKIHRVTKSLISEDREPTLFEMADLIKNFPIDDELKISALKRAYDDLDRFERERFELDEQQQELKSPQSEAVSTAMKFDILNQLRLKLGVKTLSTIQRDAGFLHQFLSPSLTISVEEKCIKQEKYSIEEFKKSPPDLLFMTGNSDLDPIDLAAQHCAMLSENQYPKICITGFGGHATRDGYVFGLSEAATMAQRFKDQSFHPIKKLIVEHDATDTGKNVLYMEPLMIADSLLEKADSPLDNYQRTILKNILTVAVKRKLTAKELQDLSGIISPIKAKLVSEGTKIFGHVCVVTNIALTLRHAITFEKQSSPLWSRISILSPSIPYILQEYYSSDTRASVNLISALREVGSVLDYKINTRYLSDRDFLSIIPRMVFENAVTTFIEYYNLLANSAIKPEVLIKVLLTKPDSCKELIHDMTNYFRKIFSFTEDQYIKRVPADVSARLQTELLDTHGTFARHNLILPQEVYRQQVASRKGR